MSFETAIDRVLAHEGGYVNDPADPGGETNFGISKRTYPDLDIKTLTREQAIEIYRRDWWERYGYERLPDAIGEHLFSFAVNMGSHMAHRLLQISVRDVGLDIEVDGVLGPYTVQQANAYRHPDVLLLLLKCGAVNYYRSLQKPRFLAGWVRRAMA
ncbi:MAG: glycosyl hydrolase 108 family protein [Dehalococcoidia bacterium]|nr:glycosyl hydrolase 108 family protein [Dehalococcoidia bacterium]